MTTIDHIIAAHWRQIAPKLPKKHKEGYRPWTEEDVAAYEARWPVAAR
jgi:hypothetical protein